ncbi:MAG: cellulose synthase operon protein YhjQ/BcsQ [Enterobacteriaceae bacterium]|jgi:cellulose biosynthesis protein BcsQ|nr:cellulose synthase operon protein YhjQ/BcsQ [Enterobacteriaceae bacterium]
MTILAIQGLRGGSGATSVCASLAWALAQREQSVLLVDFSTSNLLRLYFNQPYEKNSGWALDIIQQQKLGNPINYISVNHISVNNISVNNIPAENTAINDINTAHGVKKIDYLPFGILDEKKLISLDSWLQEQKNKQPTHLPDELSFLSAVKYDWIIIDCSSTLLSLVELAESLADINIFTLNPDIGCQVLLKQRILPANSYFLINRFIPISLVQQDVSHVWQQCLAGFIPVILHADEAQAESLALKKPVGECRPDSLISNNFIDLADWCLTLNQPNHKDSE